MTSDIAAEGASDRAGQPARSGRPRPFLVAGVFLLLGAALLACAAWVGVTQWARITSVQKDGVRAVGVFHDDGAENCRRHRCWAEIEVDGRKVEAELPPLTSTRERRHRVRDGLPVVVRYLPSDPTVAVEDQGLGRVGPVVSVTGMFGGIFLVAGLARMVFEVRRRTSVEPS
ncbi:DUF3592 domain-containing protein [Streptomyces adustus]|uniref:DUF3592 domain-containing protein n=1 Tax=Streptomyces adustus TaxID=1609272 RepID=UPI003723ACA5